MKCLDCGEGERVNNAYCRECKNARWRIWYARNSERRYQATKRWREVNPQKLQAQSERYQSRLTPEGKKLKYKNALESHIRSNQKRRAKKEGAFVEHVEPLVLLEQMDGICGICGRDVDPFNFHVDHVIPICRGGKHSYANTQISHPLCNLRKGSK